jgi:multidrug efflux pump subunit AcrA (membrane-fusion protein)
VTGFLEAVLFKEGDTVKEGAPLTAVAARIGSSPWVIEN